MHRVLERQLRKLGIQSGAVPTPEQWSQLLERIDRAYVEADQDRYTLERALDLSSAEMRKRFDELRAAQGQLVEASRKAGMADVATNVLHNIGNVLNSVNITAGMLADALRTSPRSGLSKTMTLLSAQPKAGEFLDNDARGKKVLPFLAAVDKALTEERDSMMRELESLAKHVQHISAIVATQLAAARGAPRAQVKEQVVLSELVEDALLLAQGRGDALRCDIVREYMPVVIETDRHKLMQIIGNLVANARDAVAATGERGVITLRTRRAAGGNAALEVIDNGVGIPGENLQRIFNHGFTTKAQGHGFGLHASACAAVELGGKLYAASGGAGKGATFVLELPRVRANTKPGINSNAAPAFVGEGK